MYDVGLLLFFSIIAKDSLEPSSQPASFHSVDYSVPQLANYPFHQESLGLAVLMPKTHMVAWYALVVAAFYGK